MNSTNQFYSRLATNIKRLRDFYNESTLDLAFAIGLSSPNAITNYETGTRIPKRDVIINIAKHYNITIDELLNGEFSSSQKFGVAISEIKNHEQVFQAMFPIISSKQALNNPNFRLAYERHKRFFSQMFGRTDGIDVEDINKSVELYELALEDHIIEAAANLLCWLFLCGLFYALSVPEISNCENANKEVSIEFIRSIFLSEVSDETTERNIKIKENIDEFLDEYYIDLYKNIVLLKNSAQYSELGDFYLAMCYIFGYVRNSLSSEMNRALGFELLRVFDLVGNEYAEKFFLIR